MPENNKPNELPSSKLSMSKQIDVLKTFAVIYQTKNVGASYKDVATQINVNANSVSELLKFWKESGLLSSEHRGIYIPSKFLIEFNQKVQWDKNSAWPILREALKDSWFTTELKIKFQIKQQQTENELTASLGLLSGRSKKDSKSVSSINMLIELLELICFIRKDEQGHYSLVQDTTNGNTEKISIDTSNDLMQVSIDSDLFAIDTNHLKEFVISHGKKLNKNIQQIK